jgi:hypothetical protein
MRWTALGLQVVLGLFFLLSAALKLTGAAEDMREHLDVARWFWTVTAAVEIVGAVGVLVGLASARAAVFGGLWMAALMAGGLVSHLRVGDPPTEMIAAAVLLLMGLAVVALRWRGARLGHRLPARPDRAEERPHALTH